ncbi:SDR family oxidoreductase [Chloroflexia bacterium SDU3-3]|nr:SDR family oxidoreductase [Chloroflexia bacterium SDU3-3]
MFSYKGKTALITGASSGIGMAFAHELAKRGMHVILAARSEEKLRELATQLSAQHKVQAIAVRADLSAEHGAARLAEELERRALVVDLLVNNAGLGGYGPFASISAERQHEQVMVNIAALVELTHALMPQLLARRGAVINVSSTASFQPVPSMAVYAATKAFVTSFSVALAEEYRSEGLQVVALCPGATATNFFAVLGTRDAAAGAMRTTQQVVATGLRALERGQSVAVDGSLNALLAALAKRFPLGIAAKLAARAVHAPSTMSKA